MYPTFNHLSKISGNLTIMLDNHDTQSTSASTISTPERTTKKLSNLKSFLIQFNVTHIGVALGFSAYSALLRTLAIRNKISDVFATVMWYVAVIVAVVILSLLILRLICYPHLMRKDFKLNLRTPFFVAPAIVCAGLVAASPPEYQSPLGMRIAFGILLAYQTIFALYYYARWLFSSRDTLRKARGTLFMSTTEFFILGYLGALVGFDDLGRISLSIGLLFWAIILVAFFQFLSVALGDEKPSPIMFLIIAPPASIAIAHMQLRKNAGLSPLDDFTWFFVGITLFFYLMVIRLFRHYWTGVFNVNWWAYIFPLSTAANLATRIAHELKSDFVWVLAYTAAFIASFMLVVVTCVTIHAALKKKVPLDKCALKHHFRWLEKGEGKGSEDYSSNLERPSSCNHSDEEEHLDNSRDSESPQAEESDIQIV